MRPNPAVLSIATRPRGATLGPLAAFWHLANFFAPAIGVGLIAASLAKLCWWRDLRGVRWTRLATAAILCGALVLVAGLIVFGRDGKMATYAAMVLASAFALWWAGFGPRGRARPG